jgi:hypothetical protein
MRFLRQLAELRQRYVTACGDDLRQVILISGGIEVANNHSPRLHLIPHWRIEGGLDEPPPYVVSDDDELVSYDCATINAIA